MVYVDDYDIFQIPSTIYFSGEHYPYGYLDIKRIVKGNIIDTRIQRVIGLNDVSKIRNKLSWIILNNRFDPFLFLYSFYNKVLELDNIFGQTSILYKTKFQQRVRNNFNEAVSNQKLSGIKEYNLRFSKVVASLLEEQENSTSQKIEINSMAKQIDILNKEKLMYQQENEKLQDSLNSVIQRCNMLSEDNSGLIFIGELSDLPSAIKKYENHINHKKSELSNYVKQVASLQDRILNQVEVIDKDKLVIEKYKSDIVLFQNKIDDNTKILNSLKNEKKVNQQIINNQSSEIKQLRNSLNQHNSNIQKLKKEIELKKKEYLALEAKMKTETTVMERRHFASLHHEKVTSFAASIQPAPTGFEKHAWYNKKDTNKYIRISSQKEIDSLEIESIFEIPKTLDALITVIKILGNKYNDAISELDILYLVINWELADNYFRKREYKSIRDKWGLKLISFEREPIHRLAVTLDIFCSNC